LLQSLLELLGSREKKNKASSCFSLSMCVCVLCLEAKHAEVPTLCMDAPGGLYRPTPRGYNGNPTGTWPQPPVSTPAGFSVGCWVPPAAGSSVARPAPLPRVLSAAAYCSRASDDEGFVEVSMATVGRLGGYHCSLTSSCLLNGAPASRKGVAGFWRPAMLLADWERPGRLHASLWLKGPAVLGPYRRGSWMTS